MKAGFKRALSTVWTVFDVLRKAFSVLLFLFLVFLIAGALIPDAVRVPERAALVIAPNGPLVEQLSGNPLDRALAELTGGSANETLLRDVVDAIDVAAEDSRIAAVYLRLDGLGNSGLSALQDVAAALTRFRASGKPVIAAADAYTRDQYFLAAHADEIFMNPLGVVLIDGYSRFQPYFRQALDNISIDYVTWSAGEYKSFVEPYSRDDMSAEDREASLFYLEALWQAYQESVTAARGLDADALQVLGDNFSAALAAANDDAAVMAVNAGLVDSLLSRREISARMIEHVGPAEAFEDEFARVGYRDFLAATRDLQLPGPAADRVAVVTLAGTILDGNQPPGSIGGESAARLIRQVSRDEAVKAIVLRVDSPGGSAFASELIRAELVAFQASGRPLVVSMGSVAASGGYWVSMSADQIWARGSTITGSIGVGAVVPVFNRALERLGVTVDGVGTTRLGGQFSQLSGFGEDAQNYYGASVREIYRRFVTEVATARDRSVDDIDAVARGRVWTGQQAYDAGLVDELGSLTDAIEAAAQLAGLAADSYQTDFIEPPLEFPEQLLLALLNSLAPVLAGVSWQMPWHMPALAWLRDAAAPFDFLDEITDPRGVYSHCLCEPL